MGISQSVFDLITLQKLSMEEKIGFNIKLRLKWYMYLYASKFPLRNEIKFDLYTIYQTTDRLQKCVELDRPIDARPIDGKAFRSQLEIMIIIVYITVYLELCNCVILINLLVYMQNNCLLFNLYYIYNFPTFDYAMLFIEKLLVFTLYECFRCEQKIVVY